MNIDLKKRLQNKAFILSVISFVVLCVKTFTGYDLPEGFDQIIELGLGLLTGLGIVVDPTTPGIADSKEETKAE